MKETILRANAAAVRSLVFILQLLITKAVPMQMDIWLSRLSPNIPSVCTAQASGALGGAAFKSVFIVHGHWGQVRKALAYHFKKSDITWTHKHMMSFFLFLSFFLHLKASCAFRSCECCSETVSFIRLESGWHWLKDIEFTLLFSANRSTRLNRTFVKVQRWF